MRGATQPHLLVQAACVHQCAELSARQHARAVYVGSAKIGHRQLGDHALDVREREDVGVLLRVSRAPAVVAERGFVECSCVCCGGD